jgi:hypothetical protein
MTLQVLTWIDVVDTLVKCLAWCWLAWMLLWPRGGR